MDAPSAVEASLLPEVKVKRAVFVLQENSPPLRLPWSPVQRDVILAWTAPAASTAIKDSMSAEIVHWERSPKQMLPQDCSQIATNVTQESFAPQHLMPAGSVMLENMPLRELPRATTVLQGKRVRAT